MNDEFRLARAGAAVRLGPELARGGEGVVYTLADHCDRLLKLYLAPPSTERAAKLGFMTALNNGLLGKVAAWPEELVVDRQGRTRGFVMRRASSSAEAHELYSPKSRARTFPEADFPLRPACGLQHRAGLRGRARGRVCHRRRQPRADAGRDRRPHHADRL